MIVIGDDECDYVLFMVSIITAVFCGIEIKLILLLCDLIHNHHIRNDMFLFSIRI